MQSFEGELNHLAKLEEFLRVKGSRRICEADEKEEIKNQEEVHRCEQEISRHDALLEEIFGYAGSDRTATIINNFNTTEIQNFSMFVLLCEVLQESIIMRRELENIRQRILDQRDMNESRDDKHDKRLLELKTNLNEQHRRSQEMAEKNETAEALIMKVLKGIDDLVRLARCDITPLLTLLGNHKEVTKWNVTKFLKILEAEVKSLIEVVYGAVKPPAPTPRGRKPAPGAVSKLVADPYVELLRPNTIDKLVPYQPCAYCVEDYIMNLVFETPAVPADEEYIQSIFRLEDVNTKFGIYTLTIPTNKSGKANKRKMKGEKRRNYDSSRFKEAYMKVIKDNWSVYKASKEYSIPWSTLRRHIATHGGESFDLPKLGRPFTLDSDLEFFSLLSVPEVPQSSSSSTRRAKRNPQARYLTPQSTNNMDSPEEKSSPYQTKPQSPLPVRRPLPRFRVPSASPTPGPSTESNLKRKLPRVKVEKTPKSNKSTMCDYCGVHYSQDVALRNGAVWVECMSCGKWYHQECTGTESPQFLCDNCDKVDFSGTDDSDWAPE
ncbi:unnamed protein product, partial [Iphiclides podalirius]